jgi:hypothetical protein
MAKQMYTAAPPIVRRQIEDKFTAGYPIGALLHACAAGYDVPEPSMTHNRELDRLRGSDPVAAADYGIRHSVAIDVERRAHLMWLGRRAWAAQPSAAELAAEQAASQATAERETRVQLRTLEILAAAEGETRAKRVAEARKRAEKEIGQ